MNVECDRDVDILYIKLSDSKIVDTRMLDEDVYVDVGKDEKFVGLEIWRASRMRYCPYPGTLQKTLRHPLANLFINSGCMQSVFEVCR